MSIAEGSFVIDELNVQEEAEVLEGILGAFADLKERSAEKFYPINRAARRAAEKRERKQRFVNKPGGKTRDGS